jgi:hypothetical protein
MKEFQSRWKFLSRNVDIKLEHVPTVVYSCFVLHNYCEYNQHGLEEQDIQAQILRHRNEEENTPNVLDPVYSPNTDEGEYVRSILTEYIRQMFKEKLCSRTLIIKFIKDSFDCTNILFVHLFFHVNVLKNWHTKNSFRIPFNNTAVPYTVCMCKNIANKYNSNKSCTKHVHSFEH